ncbi:MAG: hypothetical protein HY744_11755 [Deltaproteobacteria bacterium]|nr:hypothetical protein [Deltaproteobacteria bacterium]
MNRARLKATIVLAGMFLLGGVTGAGAMRAFDDRELGAIMGGTPAEARRLFQLRALGRKLGLSPEQRARAAEILRQKRGECAGLDQQIWQRRARCRQQALDAIAELLTPEQRRRLEIYRRRLAERERLDGGT